MAPPSDPVTLAALSRIEAKLAELSAASVTRHAEALAAIADLRVLVFDSQAIAINTQYEVEGHVQ